MSGATGIAVVEGRLKTLLGKTANVWAGLADLTDPGAFKTRYCVDGEIHAYEITRDGSQPNEGHDSEAITRKENVVIYGYMAFKKDGSSDPVFQAEVDSILAAFDPPRVRQFLDQQTQAQSGIDWSDAPRVEGPRVGRFGQYTIHYCRITVTVTFGPIF